MYLKADIHSLFRPAHKYGNAGDQVRIIDQSERVVIVENEVGERFPVSPEDLSEDKSESVLTNPSDTVPYLKTTGNKQRRSKPADTVTLKTLF